MITDATLRVINLECIREDRILFSELNFSLHSGELLILQGTNGAGKTSLLRILLGLMLPTAGEICWGQQSILNYSAEYRKALIYVGHKLGIKLNLTVYENLQFIKATHAISNNFEFADVLLRLNLQKYISLPARQLSAGQQQRLALARLFIVPASFWILDEPFTALDATGKQIIKDCITHHISQGGMVVLTSHQSLEFQHVPIKYVNL